MQKNLRFGLIAAKFIKDSDEASKILLKIMIREIILELEHSLAEEGAKKIALNMQEKLH